MTDGARLQCSVYLHNQESIYPSDFDVHKKRSLRRKAEQYDVDNGEIADDEASLELEPIAG